MAKKAAEAEAAALSEAMLRALESQRGLGGGAYPSTLRRLAELCGGTRTDEQIRKSATKPAFKSKIDPVKRVDGKLPLDTPVYLKGDTPKVDPIAELAGRMLLVLEAQRRLGEDAYPPTLRRLAELCGLNGSDTRGTKAAAHKVFGEMAVVAGKVSGKPGLDAPVLLKEDTKGRATPFLPALLRFALTPAPPTGKGKKTEADAFPPSELEKRFVDILKKPFKEALDEGIERETLPPDVAWVFVKDKPHLFFLDRLRRRASHPPLPADGRTAPPALPRDVPPATPGRGFAEAFREAFDRLDRRNGSTNFVKLADLRRALAGFGREEFDAELRRLRLAGLFSLDSHEGLHGSLSPEEREAGVREAGSLLVYASRR